MEQLARILDHNKSESINIDIGTKVNIKIEGVNFSVTSIFIGMLEDEFMMVALPKEYKSVKNKLFPSDTIIVKYMHDGSVYAFQTSVIETITKPIRSLAIGYPKVVQQIELRGAKRNNVVIPARVEVKKTRFSAVVFDISKSGCRFKHHDNIANVYSLREGDILRIYCQFPGVADEVGTIACVQNIRRAQGQFTIGAQFQDISKEFLTHLIHLLYSIEDFY